MTDARGKLGGQVFSKSRSGAYIATKTIPRNTQSQSQLRRRSDFAQFSNEWNNLTDFEQEAWNKWAKEHPLTDAFGDAYVITGRNFFTKNMTMLKLALAQDYETVSKPVFLKQSNWRVGRLNISNSAKTISFSGGTGSRSGYYSVVFLSKPYYTERSISNIEFRYIFGDISLFSTSDRYNRYVSIFGAPRVGDFVYYRLFILTPSGQSFSPQEGVCEIV